MVCVLDTNDNFALASATTALDQAEIVYDVVPIADVPDNLKVTNPKWCVRPSRILVAAEDEGEARALVERFQSPVEKSELGTDLERLSASDGAESRRCLVTFSRAATIVGVPLGAMLVVLPFSYSGVISEKTSELLTTLFGVCFFVALAVVGVGVIVDGIRK